MQTLMYKIFYIRNLECSRSKKPGSIHTEPHFLEVLPNQTLQISLRRSSPYPKEIGAIQPERKMEMYGKGKIQGMRRGVYVHTEAHFLEVLER